MCKPLVPKKRVALDCPCCGEVNVYTKKQIEKAEAYGYYICRNCGVEYNEYGFIDNEYEE